jgi:hypothetical protein
MTKDELRRKNDRLRDKIDQILEQHPELRDVTEVNCVQAGLACASRHSIPRTSTGQAARAARAIMDRRLELEHYFDERSPTL